MRCLIALLLLAALTWPATVPAAEKIKVTIPAAAVTFASLYQAKRPATSPTRASTSRSSPSPVPAAFRRSSQRTPSSA